LNLSLVIVTFVAVILQSNGFMSQLIYLVSLWIIWQQWRQCLSFGQATSARKLEVIWVEEK
jgi:hypothetical protein